MDAADDALDRLEFGESQSGCGQTYPSTEPKAWQPPLQPAAGTAVPDFADEVQAVNAAVCSSILLDSCGTQDGAVKVAQDNPALEMHHSLRSNATAQPSLEVHRSMGSAAELPRLKVHKSLRSTAAEQASKAASEQTSKAEQVSKASDSDVEKGSSQEDSHQPVDFLGGFSVNSTFDPHKDV